jgi:hypothetical protein
MLNIFTIVLNGQPYIARHVRVFESLPFRWKWSVVHGIADPIGCTSWVQHLDRVNDDGTVPYLKHLESFHKITLVRRDRWPGKLAMVNAALDAFTEPGILLQVDADEIWTADQLVRLVELFESQPDFDAAFFFCRYFVGPRRVITQTGSFGNHTDFEWLRAWRWKPGQRFLRHEPPVLKGQGRIIPHNVTASAGLIFDHYAYADPDAVAFKERFYGYDGALEAWKRLNERRGPVDVRGVLPWVHESAISHEIG